MVFLSIGGLVADARHCWPFGLLCAVFVMVGKPVGGRSALIPLLCLAFVWLVFGLWGYGEVIGP